MKAAVPDSTRLDRLRDYYHRHRAMPTYGGLAALMGYRSKAAAFKLAARLNAAGFLNTGPGQRIVPTDLFLARPIAGSVRAGQPEGPAETLFESVSLDSLLIDTPSTTVFVRVAGDSMIESGILDGDLAIIDRGLNNQGAGH
jgi:SOS-response transcriptional repressor LexA